MNNGQNQIVEALLKPEAYEDDPGKIELMQTHISFVFLTRNYVYKVKKAVDLGFLDFTTLEKRRIFCEKELELNRRLCKDMYLEVVPINKSEIIRIKGQGKTIEYAVKMKRMPQETIMSNLLEEHNIDTRVIERLAKIVAEFHSKARTDKQISDFGNSSIRTNWEENFDQTLEFIDKTVSRENYSLTRRKIEGFMKENESLFDKRTAERRIRDCHGDIHSGNIFVTNGIYIFDAIEFNERIRYTDVAADVGFLAMDLDYRGRPDLSVIFVERYVEYSGDKDLLEVLAFYKCYRAYVRGKVISLKLKDPNVAEIEKIQAVKEAKAYFKLASSYARAL